MALIHNAAVTTPLRWLDRAMIASRSPTAATIGPAKSRMKNVSSPGWSKMALAPARRHDEERRKDAAHQRKFGGNEKADFGSLPQELVRHCDTFRSVL
jgi:hypothetical protein